HVPAALGGTLLTRGSPSVAAPAPQEDGALKCSTGRHHGTRIPLRISGWRDFPRGRLSPCGHCGNPLDAVENRVAGGCRMPVVFWGRVFRYPAHGPRHSANRHNGRTLVVVAKSAREGRSVNQRLNV